MSAHDDGGPAFPRSGFEVSLSEQSFSDTHPEEGMSLRDWFAGKALTGLLTEPENVHCISIPKGGREVSEALAADLAWSAYIIADAMLAARKASK